MATASARPLPAPRIHPQQLLALDDYATRAGTTRAAALHEALADFLQAVVPPRLERLARRRKAGG